MLNSIASDLGSDTNPATLAKCADFLVLHKQYDRAVELYVMAKKYVEAIEMCLSNRVNISEEMVDTLTPPVPESNANNTEEAQNKDQSETKPAVIAMTAEQRKDILKDIGKALKIQGSFILASKKYVNMWIWEYVGVMLYV